METKMETKMENRMENKMQSKVLNVPNYIGGRFISDKTEVRSIVNYLGEVELKVEKASDCAIEHAISNAKKNQKLLGHVPKKEIVRVLNEAMDYFFDEEWKYELVTRITGSSFDFVKGGIEYVKEWCRNLDKFVLNVFGDDFFKLNGQVIYKSTSPVFVILPGNSEQEFLYIVAQTLLSGNASIIRSSSKNAGSFVAMEFVNALNKVLDKRSDIMLEPLRSAVSLVDMDVNSLLKVNVDNWNYVIFGSDETVDNYEKSLCESCKPKEIVKYCAGLSTSIIFDDCDIDNAVCKLLESVSSNRGNECISTDIVYVFKPVYDEVLEKLKTKAAKCLLGNPFDEKFIGILPNENLNFIYRELAKRGKLSCLDTQKYVKSPVIVPIHKFETALEYPGPVVSVRKFSDMKELKRLIEKDLNDNCKDKSLVTSLYGSEDSFDKSLNVTRAHSVKHNIPTHDLDLNLPHQGFYLLDKLVKKVYVFR